ncbi:MAG: TniQ family protein [Terracidiphilus sp.]
MGVGTELVESLTGYVARLADAHSVSVGDLVGRVLADLTHTKDAIITQTAKAVRVGGHGFRACNYTPNGVTETAVKWVDALDAATNRNDLQYLTLLPLRYIVPSRLFSRRRAWCALCFEQWRSAGQIVYEPLIWSIQAAANCQVHARPLDLTCGNCARTLSPLGVFSRPGYCERCDSWLGMSDSNGRRLLHASGEEGHNACSTMQVGGLLTMIPLIDPIGARAALCRSLASYLDQLTSGNVVAMAEYIHCPPSILRNWLDGATVPTLENLLRTCRFLNVPITSLVASSGPSPANIDAAKEAIARAGSRGVSLCQKKSEVRQALEKALHDPVPLSLSEVARRLGYKSTERLYQADRVLCHKIAARHRQSGHSHWWKKPGAARICEVARLKEILEQSLKSINPTSVHQIAADLGYANEGYIRQKFPELCAAISKRASQMKQIRSLRIRQTLEGALNEFPAPTLVDLSRRLGYSTSAVLRAHEPGLCDLLARRHRDNVRKYRSDLKRAAKATLNETPIPSVRDLCKRLGVTVWFMGKYFPSVRHMIAEKRRRVATESTKRRREKLLQDTYNIAAELQRRGEYPSINRIREELPEGSCTEWKTLSLATHAARQALRV